ncbi:class I SAM-dependent methyltransferase [Paenibacillus polysaccharolyticus]|uniref:class I SAM-dependent methyltransferase n=1 Tax=Paenibacillus polysaccharolyticus TaxID=582692 RepID=UPI00203C0A40|nr:class I SAM-dependent methyltransferase [Paenibacillus polysaccharolyticus]MCM3135883.1 class I SAM-dependent methyltransferase [Paenibacillus polysaccharolyticus]
MDNDKKVILYGAGKNGRQMYTFLKLKGYENVVYSFCDERAQTIKEIDGVKVCTYEELKETNLPYYISVREFQEVEKRLLEDGKKVIDIAAFVGEEGVSFYRDYCAHYHIDNMDDYFENAEKESSLNVFWSDDSPFYEFFRNLDLSNVIELACGRGRHVQKYVDKAKHITLVDILDKNIEVCQKRYQNYSNISYYKNSGYDLKELESEKYSSLFSYDAMVHFEMFDIYNYMKEIGRVLQSGGYALLHHSNTMSNYKISFAQGNAHGRNYLSKELFAYIAHRAGFEVIEQKEIDWGIPNLDCISLVRKPD